MAGRQKWHVLYCTFYTTFSWLRIFIQWLTLKVEKIMQKEMKISNNSTTSTSCNYATKWKSFFYFYSNAHRSEHFTSLFSVISDIMSYCGCNLVSKSSGFSMAYESIKQLNLRHECEAGQLCFNSRYCSLLQDSLSQVWNFCAHLTFNYLDLVLDLN